MYYRGITGTKYTIGQVLGKGGEGTIYTVDGNPEIVLKEYIPNKRTIDKQRKLEIMLNSNLPPNALNQITWPTDIVFDNDIFVGYVMPLIRNGQAYNAIFSHKFNFTLEQKLVIAMNLCAAVDSVHGINQVCGDLNPKNIQVDVKSANIRLIDTDSFHIQDYANNQIYRCGVGMAEYLAPEVQLKAKDGLDRVNLPTFTKQSDLFALAVHIFTMLMNGCHPFTCAIVQTVAQESVVRPSMIENIANGNFVFYQNTSQHLTTPIYAPKFEFLPEELQQMFVRAFVYGHANPMQRPSAAEWYKVLYGIYTSAPSKTYLQWANAVTPQAYKENKVNKSSEEKTNQTINQYARVQQENQTVYQQSPKTEYRPGYQEKQHYKNNVPQAPKNNLKKIVIGFVGLIVVAVIASQIGNILGNLAGSSIKNSVSDDEDISEIVSSQIDKIDNTPLPQDNNDEEQTLAQENLYAEGVVSGSTYINESAGIEFHLPQNASFATQEDIISVYGESDEVTNYEMLAIDTVNMQEVIVISERLPLESITIESYMASFKSNAENANPNMNFEDIDSKMIGKKDFLGIESTGSDGTYEFNQRYYFNKIDDTILCMIFTSYPEYPNSSIDSMIQNFVEIGAPVPNINTNQEQTSTNSEPKKIFLKDMETLLGNEWRIFSTTTDNLGTEYINAIYKHFADVGGKTYKLEGLYQSISGTFFLREDEKNSSVPTILEIYGDDQLLFSASVSAGVEPIDFNIDIKGIQYLEIKYNFDYLGDSAGAIGNCELTKIS